MIWLLALLLVGFVTVPRRNVTRRRRRKERPQKPARPNLDMGAIVTEVATRLRSGSTPERAWAQTLEHAGLPSADPVLDEDGVPLALRRIEDMGRRERKRVGVNDVVLHTLPATYAVCKMSFRTGAPMAEVLESCAAGITESGEAKSTREVALAGPRTSAHMLAGLPAVGLMLGVALGADPLGFLLTTPLGHLALAGGLGFEVAGVVWTKRLVAHAQEKTAPVDEGVVLDLAAAALSAGLSIPGTLKALDVATGGRDRTQTANLLLMGASWEEAWEGEEDRLRDALWAAWTDGAAPVPLIERSAKTLRLQRQRNAKEAAARLGAKLVLPLGLCFLPAFILLGIVPVVAGAASALF